MRGGVGNQLFSYAAARRLALKNDAELVIDNVSGFTRDLKYRRCYALHRFGIPARLASPAERFFPCERLRRLFAKLLSRGKNFESRSYLEQEFEDFDPRLLSLRFQGDIYLDGLWQSELYFSDMEGIIRRDLLISPPEDEMNSAMARCIAASRNAVALHVRWFLPPEARDTVRNVALTYYERAVALALEQLEQPHFFIFSDDIPGAVALLSLPAGSYTVVGHNKGDGLSYADLWLMTLCRNFITANSTFSWWGAWLSSHAGKLVITPDPKLLDARNYWRMAGLLPDAWRKI